ncbi:MAG: ATP-binding cassette domain-containing protein [Nocardioides sp.]
MSLELDATVADRDVEIALDLAAGETVAVLGPNGAGKSTLLSVVAGLLRPDRGHVRLDDRVLTDATTHLPPHERRVALLAQDPLLFPHLSVLENVAFGPRSRGAGRRESEEAARRWLAEVEAGDLADRKPGQVSGGQGQRVALARALAAEPRLLLLDEPMSALDITVLPALRQTLRRVLADRTVVLVTHDVLDALLLADRVVVMEGGRIVEAGRTAEVLERPRSAFAARIAGLNLVSGVWRHGAVDGVRGIATDPAPADGDPAVAVFRPSAVSVFRSAPGGSPRNTLPVTVTDLEPRGDQVRVRAGHLAADVTVQSAAELDLAPGTPVVFAIKASEVAIHRR